MVKTTELIGAALDWAVAKCEGKNGMLHDDGITRCTVIAAASGVYKGTWKPSVNWSQGGPIIEREKIQTAYVGIGEWRAQGFDYHCVAYGPTPLIAAMRCFVAFKLGDEIDIPKEFLND